MGAILFSLRAKSERAWRALVERMMSFYATALFNPNWGEQIGFAPGRRLSVTMVSHGLVKRQMEALWQPLLGWVLERPADYTFDDAPAILAVPAQRFWDPAFLRSVPGLVMQDSRPGASPDDLFWSNNVGETAQVLHAYQSAWIPSALLADNRMPSLVDALIAAAQHWPVTLHTNKGLAGGSAEALASAAETAMSPQVLSAFALLICSAEGPAAWPGIPGHEPDVVKGREEAAAVTRAMRPIRALVPDAGAYVSEADYFQRDWQQAYWGDHYPRLQEIKRKYDPYDLFHGHQTVHP